MAGIELQLALIGVAGIAAQWMAWRLNLPAIALLFLFGLIAGPFTGFFDPVRDLGEVYKPVIALAVAIILFEGGLTLNFKEISETSKAVRRIIFPGGPLVAIFSTLCAHYLGGLSWQTSILLGCLLVVTGPTVIMPLLRQAKLKKRPASLLRWEAIVNDPIGALLAVLAFEIFLVINNVHDAENLFLKVAIAGIIALPGAWLFARLIIWLFLGGHIAEFLKAPLLLVAALIANAVTNLFLEEGGLLTVTIMGIILANSRIASLAEMKRFKETITILLVSGVFILLTASLSMETILSLGWEAVAFVFGLLFIARPLAIWLATIGAGLTWQERLLTMWIAPRGIVAVAVAGLFGATLVEQGVSDGDKMIAYTFAVVAATIILHGFSLPILARVLDLRATDKPGILLVGSSHFTTMLAEKLKSAKIPTLIADDNWNHLRLPRNRNLPTYFGDVLSEHAHYEFNSGVWGAVIAATDNDAYNALVCTDFGPEIGRGNVFQIGRGDASSAKRELHFTLGGRPLFKPTIDYEKAEELIADGWVISASTLTKEFTAQDYTASRPEGTYLLFWIRPNGEFRFASNNMETAPQEGATVFAFGPKPERKKAKAEASETDKGDDQALAGAQKA